MRKEIKSMKHFLALPFMVIMLSSCGLKSSPETQLTSAITPELTSCASSETCVLRLEWQADDANVSGYKVFYSNLPQSDSSYEAKQLAIDVGNQTHATINNLKSEDLFVSVKAYRKTIANAQEVYTFSPHSEEIKVSPEDLENK